MVNLSFLRALILVKFISSVSPLLKRRVEGTLKQGFIDASQLCIGLKCDALDATDRKAYIVGDKFLYAHCQNCKSTQIFKPTDRLLIAHAKWGGSKMILENTKKLMINFTQSKWVIMQSREINLSSDVNSEVADLSGCARVDTAGGFDRIELEIVAVVRWHPTAFKTSSKFKSFLKAAKLKKSSDSSKMKFKSDKSILVSFRALNKYISLSADFKKDSDTIVFKVPVSGIVDQSFKLNEISVTLTGKKKNPNGYFEGSYSVLCKPISRVELDQILDEQPIIDNTDDYITEYDLNGIPATNV